MGQFDSIRFLSGRPLLRELSADRLNTILQEIRRNKPKGERGITVRQDGTGTYIGLAAAPNGGGASTIAARHPFQIKSFPKPGDGEETNEYIVTVLPGTINSLLPADIFDGSTLKQNEIPKNALRYVILEANSNGQQFTSASIRVDTTTASAQTPQPFGLPESAEFLVGIVYNSSVYQVINTNLSLAAKQQFVTSKTSPAAPGELPYEIYYVWG